MSKNLQRIPAYFIAIPFIFIPEVRSQLSRKHEKLEAVAEKRQQRTKSLDTVRGFLLYCQ